MKNPSNGPSALSESRSVKPDLLREFGQRLRKAREASGLSVDEASRASGVQSAMIGRYERAESEAGVLKVAALAKAYGTCCDWLLGQESEMGDLTDVRAVVDIDLVEKIENAATEEDMRKLICYDPAPFLAILEIPKRYKIISAHSASVLGARIYDRLRTIAPKAHREWAKKFTQRGVL